MPFSFDNHMWARRCAIAQATRDLEAHSDRVLADMGVSRRDIAVIARGGYVRSAERAGRPADAFEQRLLFAPAGSKV